MRNLLITMVLCGIAHVASAQCTAAPAMAPVQTPRPAELISAAAAQTRLETTAAQDGGVMLPASVHSPATQVMGGPPGPAAALNETPRHGSRLAMVLAALGLMIVIVLRRLGSST